MTTRDPRHLQATGAAWRGSYKPNDPHALPVPGDIVILCAEAAARACTVAVSPSPPALRFDTYEKALEWARHSARRARVDVWVLEDQRTTLVDRHRSEARRASQEDR